ncbi:MAG: ABC transporter substrate-binding protein [Dethiobacter sp.]|jgi:branched-chain amino acid transport system substrate-binding protein|nr:ABC transporter substrate-binding protein [Dethiobacter sp.]
MKKWSVVLLVISMLLLSIVAVGCPAGQDEAETEVENPDKFTLGVLLPLTGPFSAVAKTQEQGALLAIEEINAAGGLEMPWGKVPIVPLVMDDQASLDVGVRRFEYLREAGADAVVGQTWAPLALAINEITKDNPFLYFPVAVTPRAAFQKGTLAPTTWVSTFSPWTVGYMAASAAINELGKKEIFFLARSDAWGHDMKAGVEAAAAEYGATIVGYEEVPLGTADFLPVLGKVRAAAPDVFISAQFGADAIALLNQVNDQGLNDEMTIFNAFITNVIAKGLAPEALEGLYAMHFHYWDLSEFEDAAVAQATAAYVEAFQAMFEQPPDAYTAIAYIATRQLLDAVQAAGTFDTAAVSEHIRQNPDFETIKGPARWREDQSVIYDYASFLVRGKPAAERTGDWDLFEVVGYQGGERVLEPLEALGY